MWKGVPLHSAVAEGCRRCTVRRLILEQDRDLLKSSGMTTALFQRMIRSYTRRGDLSASSYGVPSEGDAASSSESESDVSEDEVNVDAAREVERIESENILGPAFNK